LLANLYKPLLPVSVFVSDNGDSNNSVLINAFNMPLVLPVLFQVSVYSR